MATLGEDVEALKAEIQDIRTRMESVETEFVKVAYLLKELAKALKGAKPISK